MILLGVIVAALGLIAIACLTVALWPDERETLDELEARRRLRPRTGFVDRYECADPEADWIADQEKGAS